VTRQELALRLGEGYAEVVGAYKLFSPGKIEYTFCNVRDEFIAYRSQVSLLQEYRVMFSVLLFFSRFSTMSPSCSEKIP